MTSLADGGEGLLSRDLLQELSIQQADLQAHDRRSLSNKTDTHCHILMTLKIKIVAINKWETDKADIPERQARGKRMMVDLLQKTNPHQ
jgi:hypothetical protein